MNGLILTQYGTRKRVMVALDKICGVFECQNSDGAWFAKIVLVGGTEVPVKQTYDEVLCDIDELLWNERERGCE